MASQRHWRKKIVEGEWTSESRVSEQELLNRVILTKALQVHASNQTMHLKTEDEDFEITPRVARDVMKASGKWPNRKARNWKPPKIR